MTNQAHDGERVVTDNSGEWVLVPREPTKEMLHAAAKSLSPDRRPTKDWVSVSQKHTIRYKAMIEAAPAYPFPDQGVSEAMVEVRGYRCVLNGHEDAVFLGYPSFAPHAKASEIEPLVRLTDYEALTARLSTASHPPAHEGVGVKELAWEPEGGTHGIYADNGLGALYFAYDDGGWSFASNHQQGAGTTLEAAKDGAQADYERRILSALAIHPSKDNGHG